MEKSIDLNILRDGLQKIEDQIILLFYQKNLYLTGNFKSYGIRIGREQYIQTVNEISKSINDSLHKYFAGSEWIEYYRKYVSDNCQKMKKIEDEVVSIFFDDILPYYAREKLSYFKETVIIDVQILLTIKKRVFTGVPIAVSKYYSALENALILETDKEIFKFLTDSKIEKSILERIKIKSKKISSCHCCEEEDNYPDYSKLYENWIIPLTKKIQYLIIKEIQKQNRNKNEKL